MMVLTKPLKCTTFLVCSLPTILQAQCAGEKKTMSTNAKAETWEELLKNKADFIGRDLEYNVGKHYYRGPIKKITKYDDGMIYFSLKWCAESLADGVWKKSNSCLDFGISRQKCGLNELANGAVEWFSDTFFTIHSKGGNLDPSKVKGLRFKK